MLGRYVLVVAVVVTLLLVLVLALVGSVGTTTSWLRGCVLLIKPRTESLISDSRSRIANFILVPGFQACDMGRVCIYSCEWS